MRPLRLTCNKSGVVVLAATLAFTVLPANATTFITTCPYAITVPGDYLLTANLTCSGDGITIASSNVQLFLNTHRILGPGGGSSSFGILVMAADRLREVRIKGPGVVQNFGFGINFRNVDSSEVVGVFSTGNTFFGIVSSFTVTYLQLINNVITQNGAAGLVLAFSTHGDVAGNVISANGGNGGGGGPGIQVRGGGNNEIHQNTVAGNFGSGIEIIADDPSSFNRIHDNVTSGNSFAGIHIAITTPASTGNDVKTNIALGNSTFDLDDDNAACDTNIWHLNTFITSNQSCIH